jgi:hypothetical protein
LSLRTLLTGLPHTFWRHPADPVARQREGKQRSESGKYPRAIIGFESFVEDLAKKIASNRREVEIVNPHSRYSIS